MTTPDPIILRQLGLTRPGRILEGSSSADSTQSMPLLAGQEDNHIIIWKKQKARIRELT